MGHWYVGSECDFRSVWVVFGYGLVVRSDPPPAQQGGYNATPPYKPLPTQCPAFAISPKTSIPKTRDDKISMWGLYAVSSKIIGIGLECTPPSTILYILSSAFDNTTEYAETPAKVAKQEEEDEATVSTSIDEDEEDVVPNALRFTVEVAL